MLRISPQSVDLSRLREGGIPLLDHHSQAGIDQVLGRVADAWIEGGAVMGRIVFAQTEQGRKAEGMVARGELTGISAGYCVDAWTITDADGDVVDERDVRWDDDLTFHGDALAVVRGVACRCACRWRVDGAFAWGSSRHVGRHEGPHGSEAGNGRPHG